MFGVEVSAVEQHLIVQPLWLGGPGISNPVSLASHLFTSFVHATERLVRSLLVLRLLNWILILIVFLSISNLIVNS